MPRNSKGKYKKDEIKVSKIEHCKVFDVVEAIVMQIQNGWMTPDEFQQIQLGVKERIAYVTKHKVK